jgi:hypothetical protein
VWDRYREVNGVEGATWSHGGSRVERIRIREKTLYCLSSNGLIYSKQRLRDPISLNQNFWPRVRAYFPRGRNCLP